MRLRALGRLSPCSPRLHRLSTLAQPPLNTTESITSTLRRFGVTRVRPWLASSLREAGFVEPMPVQAAAMERIAKHEDLVIHSETGSGKTLAYLVPLLSRLEPGVPLQLLVLLPSRELALQVAAAIQRLLAPPAPLLVALVVGGADGSSSTADADASSGGGSSAAIARAAAHLHTQQALADEVGAGRAEVLVGTPHAVRRALHTGTRVPRDRPPPFNPRRFLEPEEDSATAWRDGMDGRLLSSSSRGGARSVLDGDDDYFGYMGDGGGSGARLLLAIASNLDAIVLDEVDALLPKPVLAPRGPKVKGGQRIEGERLDYFRQVDWAKLSRNERLALRPGGSKSPPASKLVHRLLAAVRAVRTADDETSSSSRLRPLPRSTRSSTGWREVKERRKREALDDKEAKRVQLVGASATVGKGTLMQLKQLFRLSQPPGVIGAGGQFIEALPNRYSKAKGERAATAPSATAVAIQQLRKEGKRTTAAAVLAGVRSHGARGVAAVSVPSVIEHRSLTVRDELDTARALAYALDEIRPNAVLAILPDDAPLHEWLQRLRKAGIHQSRLLHEAMGFPTRSRGGGGAASGAGGITGAAGGGGKFRGRAATEELIAAYGSGQPVTTMPAAVENGNAAAAADDDDEAMKAAVLLTTERSVRGLDLPNLDCVALLYAPHTSDAYTHLAGRVGRGAGRPSKKKGTALSLVPSAEAGRLGLFTVQLGISIKPMPPPQWLADGLAREEQRREDLRELD